MTYIDLLWLKDSELLGYNGVVGFDGSLRPTQSGRCSGSLGSAMALENEADQFGAADRFYLEFNNGEYRWFAKHEYVASDFRAEAGFIPRLGYHQVMTKLDLYLEMSAQ